MHLCCVGDYIVYVEVTFLIFFVTCQHVLFMNINLLIIYPFIFMLEFYGHICFFNFLN
jgi:hypothetical protein